MTQLEQTFPIQREVGQELPVPSRWRPTIASIVDAFCEGDFSLARGIEGAHLSNALDGAWLAQQVEGYGATLDRLSPQAWQTSICVWMGEWWEALIDLFTLKEGRSDLVLFLRIYQRETSYDFEVGSLHVP